MKASSAARTASLFSLALLLPLALPGDDMGQLKEDKKDPGDKTHINKTLQLCEAKTFKLKEYILQPKTDKKPNKFKLEGYDSDQGHVATVDGTKENDGFSV